ncbi:MAG: VUT family protein, partial [Clostridia bacterium]|nr:VUT family protein [Clostridia bacterium]
YDAKTLLSIFGSSYLIYFVTTLLDTPVLYLARKISDKKKAKENQPSTQENSPCGTTTGSSEA